MKRLTGCAVISIVCAMAWGAEPGSVQDLLERGKNEALDRHSERAAALFKMALEQDPTNRQAQLALGTVYVQMGNYRDALALLQPLLAAEPANFILINNLAWMHAVANDPEIFNPDEAERLARAALALAPTDYHVWSTLSEALYAQGHFAEALEAAEQTLRLGQMDPLSRDRLATYRAQVDKCKLGVKSLTLVE